MLSIATAEQATGFAFNLRSSLHTARAILRQLGPRNPASVLRIPLPYALTLTPYRLLQTQIQGLLLFVNGH
jgi:hypothetical protein